MRKSVTEQLPLVPQIADHEHVRELQEMSRILDSYPESAELVFADLVAGGIDPDKGAEGLSGEQVLRAALIKQGNSFSYEQLAFHLADSMSYRAFCRLRFGKDTPSSSTLQHNIKKVRPETMETINRMLVAYAHKAGVENGRKVRSDCTVIDSNIHEPTDSWLLWDCTRVLTRHLHRVQSMVDVQFTDHTRRAKRKFVAIGNAKKMAMRVPLYRDLVKVTEKTENAAKRAMDLLETRFSPDELDELKDYQVLKKCVSLTQRVLDQTRRRVFEDESVPATEKLVSIFEDHTDIIRKDRRETLYGHKISLTAGASGLVLDCVIEDGNPADSTLAVDLMNRQADIFGKPPRQACFDGGFSSKENLSKLKGLGIKDVAFSKSPGIALTEMVKSNWVYRKLKHFRAGIESVISFLKRSLGWTRCTWRGLDSFKSYTWTSVAAANLLMLARHALK